MPKRPRPLLPILALLAPRPVSAQTAGCGAARHPGVPGKTVDNVRAIAGENLTHRLRLPPG